jgi:hypothetical protein
MTNQSLNELKILRTRRRKHQATEAPGTKTPEQFKERAALLCAQLTMQRYMPCGFCSAASASLCFLPFLLSNNVA